MINTLPYVLTLAILTSVAAVILLYIFILPESRREKLPKIPALIAEFFNFKELYLEKILRLLYVFATVASIVTGTLLTLGFTHYNISGNGYTHWYGGYGLLLLILGPIAIRFVFEIIMMFIILVKNTIEINKKLDSFKKESEE